MDQEQSPSEAFAKLYAAEQSRLFAFICSLVGSHDLANDVLQETNVVIWEKRDQFTLGTNFTAWAFRIARYQVMAMREKQSRDRLVFTDGFLALIADESAQYSEQFDQRQAALDKCIEKLPSVQSELVKQRYMNGLSVKKIASMLDRSANAVSVQLHRVRCALSDCIESRLRQDQGEAP